MTVAEVGLERGKQARYFLRQPGNPDHGWSPCSVLPMSLNHPSAYLLGDQPARVLFVLLPLCTVPKRQNSHADPRVNLSSLSYKVSADTGVTKPNSAMSSSFRSAK
jgi:hypothetical protein